MGGDQPGHTVTERRVNQHNKKVYNVRMTWHATSEKQPPLAPSTSFEKKKLQHLLKEVARRLNYRNFDEVVSEPSVVVEDEAADESGLNYRIESVGRVDVSSPDPTPDLRFYIGDRTYAVVRVHLKPAATGSGRRTPREFRDVLVDDDGSWLGFGRARVMAQIDDAMIYSLENNCHTEIEWEVEEAA